MTINRKRWIYETLVVAALVLIIILELSDAQVSETDTINDINDVAIGRFLFSAPREMVVGERYKIEVIFVENTTQLIKNQSIKNVSGDQVVLINVDLVTVELYGDCFEITPLSHKIQLLAAGIPTIWYWEVTPLKAGKCSLDFEVTASSTSPEGPSFINKPINYIYIMVKEPPPLLVDRIGTISREIFPSIFVALISILIAMIILITSRLSEKPSEAPEVSESLDRLSTTDPREVQKVAASQINLLSSYYEVVLDQSRRSFLLASAAAGIGLIFLISSIIFLLFNFNRPQDLAIVSLISGALSEFISGINFYLYNKSATQLAGFLNKLDMTQRFLLANSVCEGLDGDFKQQARSDLVRAIAEAKIEYKKT